MRVILLHNAGAGQGNQPDADEILREIRDAGHTVTYQSTQEKGAKWTMLEAADLVIAAGGDGTVRKAALAVAGRRTPLAILPLGTANNLARTFGVPFNFRSIIHDLNTGHVHSLDVGIVTGPWGKTPFIESAGAGLLARTISFASNSHESASAPSIKAGYDLFSDLLDSHPSSRYTVQVDGHSFSEDLLMVEAMNIRSVGPNLRLAPDNDPGDGALDFVFLKNSDRRKFARFLKNQNDPAPVEVIRGRNLTLTVKRPVPIHVDDFTWPPEREQTSESAPPEESGPVSLDIRLTADPVEIRLAGT